MPSVLRGAIPKCSAIAFDHACDLIWSSLEVFKTHHVHFQKKNERGR